MAQAGGENATAEVSYPEPGSTPRRADTDTGAAPIESADHSTAGSDRVQARDTMHPEDRPVDEGDGSAHGATHGVDRQDHPETSRSPDLTRLHAGSDTATLTAEANDVSRETGAPTIGEMPKPGNPRIMVVANQKGGVGKTTTAVNLAAALALGGLSVLVVDLDPQANASTALGIDHPRGRPGTYEVLINGDALATHWAESPEADGLRVLPATVDLAGAEIELVSVVARENRLNRALDSYLQEHPTDYVLLDCPPSLGLLTINALVAANEVLIPIQCEYYALEGVSQLVNTIDLVAGELNNHLRLSTVLLTMYDARTRLAAQVADEVRAYFTEQTVDAVIPRSVRISEAPSYGQTVFSYHPESAGAVSYLEAAGEIAHRGAEENR